MYAYVYLAYKSLESTRKYIHALISVPENMECGHPLFSHGVLVCANCHRAAVLQIGLLKSYPVVHEAVGHYLVWTCSASTKQNAGKMRELRKTNPISSFSRRKKLR